MEMISGPLTGAIVILANDVITSQSYSLLPTLFTTNKNIIILYLNLQSKTDLVRVDPEFMIYLF